MRLLILGGTTEASALARALAERRDIAATLSLAGRTASPMQSPLPVRVGGFGGVAGLVAYLAAERIDALVDATHPFAAQMSAHAAAACAEAGMPRLVLTRPAWEEGPGDRWTRVQDIDGAVQALAGSRRTVFLTIGSLFLAPFTAMPQHRYVVRAIDPPPALDHLPDHRLILARGPFGLADEIALMETEAVDVVVTKNSGGDATRAKLDAARQIGCEVVMVDRPPVPSGDTAVTTQEALAWLDAHRPSAERGV